MERITEQSAGRCRQSQFSFAVKLMQVADGQFQDVGFFQFGQVFTFGRQSCAHQLLQLVQAPVNPRSTLTFQQRLGDLSTR